MNKFQGFSTAALITAAMSSSPAFATELYEADTINKDNTVQNTHVGVKQNTHVNNNTRVTTQGGNAYSAGGAAEQEQSLNNQNYLNSQGGNAYSAGGQGGQGGAAEQEQGQLQGQEQGQLQGQQQNATGGTSEQDQQQSSENTNENDNSNGGQENSQTSNYSSSYKATVASAYGHASTAIASSKCGVAESWGGGLQLVELGASLSHNKSDPAGVQLRYINAEGKESVAKIKDYFNGSDIFRADITEDLTTDERKTLACLEVENDNREDGQQHDKEMRVIDAHVYNIQKKADHVCRDDAKHYGSHDCIIGADNSMDSLNQMIGFKQKTTTEAAAPIAVQPAHNHN